MTNLTIDLYAQGFDCGIAVISNHLKVSFKSFLESNGSKKETKLMQMNYDGYWVEVSAKDSKDFCTVLLSNDDAITSQFDDPLDFCGTGWFMSKKMDVKEAKKMAK